MMTEDQILEQALDRKREKLGWLARERGAEPPKDVELSEDERVAALEAHKKHQELRDFYADIRNQGRKRRLEKLAESSVLWGYSDFYRHMRDESADRGVRLVINDSTVVLAKSLCFLLSHDSRYESELGFSFQKGLLIRGIPSEGNPMGLGLGKSYMPSLLANNPVRPIQMVTMFEISESIRQTGSWGEWNEKANEYRGFKFHSFPFFYLDDLGTEDMKYYGNVNWFKDWFESMYAKDKFVFQRFIISTNLTFSEIEGKYGARVRDRMAETFNVLNVSGKSFRR